ncbi:hypothetical protein [Devosia sp. CAU 1758]
MRILLPNPLAVKGFPNCVSRIGISVLVALASISARSGWIGIDLTALLFRVGKRHPELMAARDNRLLIDAIIEEGRKLPPEAK